MDKGEAWLIRCFHSICCWSERKKKMCHQKVGWWFQC